MKNASFISKQVSSGKYYYLNLNPETGTSGTVVCGGVEKCDPHYRVARNSFKYHCIEYVAAGQGELAVSDKRFPLRPGAVFYYSPKIRHEITTDPGKPLVKHFVDFCGTRFTRLLRQHPLARHEPSYFNSTPRIQDIFENLQQNGRNTGAHSQAVCACLLELLILQTGQQALSQGDAESSTQNTYRQCRDLIEQRFLALHNLGDVADACRIDAPYLCRLFQRYGSESPYQMLLRLKMRHATDLLNCSTTLIKQIAKTVGFADPYHFSRVFKKIYGVSPQSFLQSAHRVQHNESCNASSG
jgi:AraC-like DNA-binding protein